VAVCRIFAKRGTCAHPRGRTAQLKSDRGQRAAVRNYVAALDLIGERLAAGALELTPGLLKELHATTMRGLGRQRDEHFKPHHEGEWRDGIARVG
jgi:hypothetical protein